MCTEHTFPYGLQESKIHQEVSISYNFFFKAKSEFLTYFYQNSVCKARSPFLFCLEITFKPEYLPAIHLILLKAYTHTDMQRTYLSSEFLMLLEDSHNIYRKQLLTTMAIIKSTYYKMTVMLPFSHDYYEKDRLKFFSQYHLVNSLVLNQYKLT